MEATHDLICVCRNGLVEEVNPGGAALLGAEDPAILSGRPFAAFAFDDYADAVDDLLSLREIEPGAIPLRLKALSGRYVEAELCVHPAREMGLGRVVVTARDVSRQGRLARSAWDRESRFRLLVDNSMHLICRFADFRFAYINNAGCTMLGAGAEALVGRPIWDIFHDEYRGIFAESPESLLDEEAMIPVRLRRVNGQHFDAQIRVTALPALAGRQEYMLEGHDISAHIRAVAALRRINETLDQLVAERTRELERMAVTDPLTGLYNRRHFMSVAETETKRALRSRQIWSAIMVDIDFFKRINDTWGHATGDQAIRDVAAACTAQARAIDCVGRLGGEEFAIILPDTPLQAAVIAAERLRAAIARLSIRTGSGKDISLTASIGVASLKAGEDDYQAVLARADAGLYRAKDQGRNRVVAQPQQ